MGSSAAPGPRTDGGGARVSPEIDASWQVALEQLASGARVPGLVFQPIVDLRRGQIAGYEALARLPGPPDAPPDQWLGAANALGLGTRVEAAIVAAALPCIDDLPPNTFLTVNASPALLASAEWSSVRAARADLSRLVIELTEHEAVADYERIRAALDAARQCGASFGVDDVGMRACSTCSLSDQTSSSSIVSSPRDATAIRPKRP